MGKHSAKQLDKSNKKTKTPPASGGIPDSMEIKLSLHKLMMGLAVLVVFPAVLVVVLPFCQDFFAESLPRILCNAGVKSHCAVEHSWTNFSRDSSDPKIARMSAWVEDSCPGAKGLSNVYLGQFDKGNGVKVRGMGITKAMKKHSYFICMPKKCWFSQFSMHERYKQLGERYPDQCGTIQYTMAHYMADEFRKGEKSFFFPYLDMLPKQSDYEQYHPAFLKDSAQSAFTRCSEEKGAENCLPPFTGNGTDANYYWDLWYGWVNDCYKKYLEDWESGEFSIPSDEDGAELINQTPLTFDQVKLGYVITMTRDFEVVGNMPVIDMPNTEDHYNAHQYWYDKEQNLFCLLNERAVKKGDEINVNYAQENKNPYIMFAQYAFALSARKHTAGEPKCDGLGPDSDVHKCQNPVACNISGFAKRYCNKKAMKAQQDRLAAARMSKEAAELDSLDEVEEKEEDESKQKADKLLKQLKKLEN